MWWKWWQQTMVDISLVNLRQASSTYRYCFCEYMNFEKSYSEYAGIPIVLIDKVRRNGMRIDKRKCRMWYVRQRRLLNVYDILILENGLYVQCVYEKKYLCLFAISRTRFAILNPFLAIEMIQLIEWYEEILFSVEKVLWSAGKFILSYSPR